MATTLMGLVLVVLLQVLTGAMRAQEMTLEHARALQVAERVLQESCTALNLAAAQYQGQDRVLQLSGEGDAPNMRWPIRPWTAW